MLLLLAAYVLGLVGWTWDYRQHLARHDALPAHLLMYLGMGLALIAVILLLVNWARSTGVRPTGWTAVAVAGWAVTIIGVIVDVYWHGAHPGADETNMLGLPGHQIQLVGWILGVVGVGALLLRARAWSKGRATM